MEGPEDEAGSVDQDQMGASQGGSVGGVGG
jgi:hypothetical protein